MMKRLAIFVLLPLLLCTCSNTTKEEQAMQAASTYFSALLRGDYEKFLDGRPFARQLPGSYREQLITAYQQYLYQQQQSHGGLTSVEPRRAALDSTLAVMQVFLLCHYADSTTEEIVIPMVEQEGQWKMK